MKKTITILGESITIAFNMASMIGFEEITGKPFNEIDLSMSKDSIALSLAVIVANNPETKITANALMTQATGKEISELTTAVSEAFIDWNKIPVTLSDEEDHADDNPNNSDNPDNPDNIDDTSNPKNS